MEDHKSIPIIKLSKYEATNIDKNNKNNTDNIEVPVTPPARENTEVDISAQSDDEEDCLNTVNNSPVNDDLNIIRNIHVNLTRTEYDNGQSDSDSDVGYVLKEMEKIVNFDNDVRHTDDDYETELRNLAVVRTANEDKFWRAESRETYTNTPRESLGFTTRTIPELNFTWNSTVNSTQCRTRETGDNSRYTNQYLRSTASIFANGKSKRNKKREKTGVSWSNRLETRQCGAGGRKLFCLDQYEEMQIEKASRKAEKTDLSSR